MLWFAFKLVSLNHWKQQTAREESDFSVVICFQISIFEPLETTNPMHQCFYWPLWFAFKLVSLNHWKQLGTNFRLVPWVVICFQISIFEPLETTLISLFLSHRQLWFAFKLVSLNHWKQPAFSSNVSILVVICFQISIFEPLETTRRVLSSLWISCDLLSN